MPNDWYHGPTNKVHVVIHDWKEINLVQSREDPKMIKVGVQLLDEDVEDYRRLIIEYIEVFA